MASVFTLMRSKCCRGKNRVHTASMIAFLHGERSPPLLTGFNAKMTKTQVLSEVVAPACFVLGTVEAVLMASACRVIHSNRLP